ncbi:hypothetical protein HY933_04455 [Candidatus Falkowbacteria bacterium]|nr:hypothetical protein [Candidatus Falkowbacteria bacterium]
MASLSRVRWEIKKVYFNTYCCNSYKLLISIHWWMINEKLEIRNWKLEISTRGGLPAWGGDQFLAEKTMLSGNF